MRYPIHITMAKIQKQKYLTIPIVAEETQQQEFSFAAAENAKLNSHFGK